MGTRLDIGGISLGVEQVGSGQPVVLFLHGITANRRVWDPVVEKLSHRFSCVAVDQRGHGLSDKPETGYSHIEFSDDIRKLAEYLSPASGVVVVGHSLGARNAIVAAARFPAIVRGIVAIDFVPFIEPEVFDRLEQRVIDGGREFSSLEEVQAYLRARYVNIPDDAVARRATYGYHTSASGGLVPMASPVAMAETVGGLRADLEPYLAYVDVPAVLVRGAESTLVSEQAFAKACSVNDRVSSVVIDGADHYVPEEAPDEIAHLVESFIDENIMFTAKR